MDHPPQPPTPEPYEEPFASEPDYAGEPPSRYRGSSGDPAFGFLLAIAVSVGLIPMLPANADLRYTLAWGALAVVSILAWLLGTMDRIGQEQPENLFWGGLFGVVVSMPFVLFANTQLGRATGLMFPAMTAGTVLAYFIFVMPLAETLFFRGLMQRNLEFWVVGGLSTLWNLVIFFPVMWGEILQGPAVAIYLAIALFSVNLLTSYVRERNGLAAAWICQIVAILVLFFIPYAGTLTTG